MQVRPGGTAGVPRQRDNIACVDLVTLAYQQLRVVAVYGAEAHLMFQLNCPTITWLPASLGHETVLGGKGFSSVPNLNVNSKKGGHSMGTKGRKNVKKPKQKDKKGTKK